MPHVDPSALALVAVVVLWVRACQSIRRPEAEAEAEAPAPRRRRVLRTEFAARYNPEAWNGGR